MTHSEPSVSLRDAAVKAQEALAFLVCCEASGESGRHHPVVVQAQTALREALEGHALISPDATPPTNAEQSVTCCVCGHTEDPETAEERWAYRPIADQWMCEECWHDERDFPEGTRS